MIVGEEVNARRKDYLRNYVLGAVIGGTVIVLYSIYVSSTPSSHTIRKKTELLIFISINDRMNILRPKGAILETNYL